MQKSILNQDFKLFAIISFVTVFFIILFSLVGHVLTPTKLIPASFIGGTVGLIFAIYFSFKQKILRQTNILPIFICSLFAFGVISFISVFNFNNPLLIFCCFLFLGIATVIAKHFFPEHHKYSIRKFFGLSGLLFLFPAFYFITASVLKFQIGLRFLFVPVDILLRQNHGQENFNAITPFLFGGGLLFSFALNLFSQLNFRKNKKNIFRYSITGAKINLLNLTVLFLTSAVGLILLLYIIVENIK
jgi:hypothetical protein